MTALCEVLDFVRPKGILNFGRILSLFDVLSFRFPLAAFCCVFHFYNLCHQNTNPFSFLTKYGDSGVVTWILCIFRFLYIWLKFVFALFSLSKFRVLKLDFFPIKFYKIDVFWFIFLAQTNHSEKSIFGFVLTLSKDYRNIFFLSFNELWPSACWINTASQPYKYVTCWFMAPDISICFCITLLEWYKHRMSKCVTHLFGRKGLGQIPNQKKYICHAIKKIFPLKLVECKQLGTKIIFLLDD